MTQAVLIPQGERFSIETANSVVAACAGRASYELPGGTQEFPGVVVDLKHHWTGNHHSFILSLPAAKALVQVLNAAIANHANV